MDRALIGAWDGAPILLGISALFCIDGVTILNPRLDSNISLTDGSVLPINGSCLNMIVSCQPWVIAYL